jgi:hypothetical protein
MAESEHPYDAIAQDLFSWQEDMVSWTTEAMRGGHRAPFSAATSEKEKQDYYRRQMFQQNPDGSINYEQPNPGGRDRMMKTLGVQGYAQVMNSIKPKAGLRPVSESEPSTLEASTPMMPEDQAESGL